MRRLTVIVLTVLLVFSCVTPVFATSNILQAIEDLKASGKESNEYLNHSIVDLVYVSEGSVTATVYVGVYEDKSINYFSVSPQSKPSATNKITRFIFELTNRYRPETELALSISLPDRNTVHAYTYGAMKDEAMWAIIHGLPDCLVNEPYSRDHSGSGESSSPPSSWIDPYSPENIAETIITSTFTINSTEYSVASGDKTEIKTMDVAPEIKEDRTFVPVRFLAYALGVPEEGITWNGETQEVTITKEDTIIGLTIGSNIERVNKETVEMDVAPYIKQGRTMLPAKWIAEPLGATVEWSGETKQVKIIKGRN